MINREALKTFTAKAVAQIEQGAVEDLLRHLLSSNLPLIFPDSPWWLHEHILGTEHHVRFAGESGAMRGGFADAIVGKTAIEYEKNLQSKAIFDEGYEQVKEYCAALCNIGVDSSEVLGVLSDTVRWYGYRINLVGDIGKAVGKHNVVLIQESFVDLSNSDVVTFDKFDAFIKQFLARDSSRLLRANVLKMDFGVDSDLYKKAAKGLRRIINECAKENPSYYGLIKSVWSNYIGFLDVSSGGKFPLETYISELYLVIVAKVLCANILSHKAMVSSRKEIVSILNGDYFRARNIENLVDYDYFGWLQMSPCAEKFVHFVSELQKIATAYDFHAIINEDIFGELLAQLADRKHRLLLGQELTPRWTAREIVEKCSEKCKVEHPKALDMCCGSGVFLIELVKIARDNFVSRGVRIGKKEAYQILGAATGFDIDPLAIMLAKVNWILAVRDEISIVTDSITIPIYNADSLFVDTPMMRSVQTSGGEYYEMKFYDKKAYLPVLLFKNDNQRMYDALLPTIYRMAMSRSCSKCSDISNSTINAALSMAIKSSASKITDDELEVLRKAVKDLIEVLESLQREGKNGIWYFVLNNVYRPELMHCQFDIVVSNPPWLTLSKIAGNPYQESLKRKAKSYDVLPRGAAFLHVELATIFALNGVDRYLKNDGVFGMIVPSTLLNGKHHEPFRQSKYAYSSKSLQMSVDEVWQLPNMLFKNKAIAIFGGKGRLTNYPIKGRVYSEATKFTPSQYKVALKNTAWIPLDESSVEVEACGDNYKALFTQGADLMPRTALFHAMKQARNGFWKLSPIDKSCDLWYLLSDAKKFPCKDLEADGFSDDFVYSALISKHVSPFCVADPAVMILPGRIGEQFSPLTDVDFAVMNAATSATFQGFSEIDPSRWDIQRYFVDKINIYGKLKKQLFADKDYLVLSNAGGENPCAAYIKLSSYLRKKLVVDQTLYWYATSSEEEAIFLVGMLNSDAMAKAIEVYQPEGEQGRRHIHTIPYSLTPVFDQKNGCHKKVVAATKKLMAHWVRDCKNGPLNNLLHPNSGKLNSRRKIQQNHLKSLPEYSDYEDVCSRVLHG